MARRLAIDCAAFAGDREVADVARAVALDGATAVMLATANGTWSTGAEVAAATIRTLAARLAGAPDLTAIVDALVGAHRDAHAAEAAPRQGDGIVDLMIGRLTDDAVELAWAGGCRAVLVRGGVIVAEARPHCHGEARIDYVTSRDDAYADPANLPWVRWRAFGTHLETTPPGPPDLERLGLPWPAAAGDAVAIVNDEVMMRLGDRELLHLVDQGATAAAIARAAAARGPGVAAAIVATWSGA